MQRRGLAQRQNTLDAENHAQLCHAQFWYHAVLPNSSLVNVELQEAIQRASQLTQNSKSEIISNNHTPVYYSYFKLRKHYGSETTTFNNAAKKSMN